MPSARVIALVLALALVAVIGGGSVWMDQRVSAAQRERDEALAALREARALADSEKITTKVVTKYVDRVQVLREVGATITKEVPVYVTAKADAACAVPVGFVRLHDAAAEGHVPEPAAGDPDAPATGVTLSTIADTVTGNYTTCHEIRAELIGLQEWVAEHSPPLRTAP